MSWSWKNSVVMMVFLLGVLAGSAVNGFTRTPVLPGHIRVPLFVISLVGLCFYPLMIARTFMQLDPEGPERVSFWEGMKKGMYEAHLIEMFSNQEITKEEYDRLLLKWEEFE